MSDGGEAILILARKILSGGYPAVSQHQEDKSTQVKATCLAAVLAALGGPAAAHIACQNNRPVNRFERFELDALVFYVARERGLQEEKLRREIEALVGAPLSGALCVPEYRIARNALLSLLCDPENTREENK